MTVLGLITARGGSKGIPHKNIVPLAGKPLIAWTIEAALGSRSLDRTIVSTDDPEIAAAAAAWGAETPFLRPSELAQDGTPHLLVVEQALRWLEEQEAWRPDYVLLLQPTSPLRTTADIDAAIALAVDRQAAAVIGVCEARHHPYLCKQILPGGVLTSFGERAAERPYLRRQDLPLAYALNGAIYVNRCDALLASRTFLPPGSLAYVMPPERSLDIDSSWDLHLAELILRDLYGQPDSASGRT